MKKLEIKILFLIIFISITGCMQNKKNRNMMNFIEELKETNNAISDSPIYLYNFTYSNVNIEIYINEQLFLKSYYKGNEVDDNHLINHYLNKEVHQKLKVIVKPINDKYFNQQSYFTIHLSSLPDRKTFFKKEWKESKKIIEYTTNEFARDANGAFTRDSTGAVVGYIKEKKLEGKSYFEKEFEFEAEMPFENEALNNSKDLQKIDKKVLEQKVLEQYQRFVNSVKNKDEKTYWELYYHKIAYFAKANFLTENDIENLKKEGKMYYKMMSYQPIENYEMVFYDEGRLVCFESKSNELEFKGKSPLIATAVNPNDPNDVFRNPIQFYFYMPKDSNELKIMY